jgi:hypothetical protein
MLNKLIVVTFSLVLIYGAGFSQNDFRNGIFLEIGGNGYMGSINYERKSSNGITGRIGFYFINPKDLIVLPLTVGKVFGKKNHHIEIAGGFSFGRNSDELINRISSTRKFVYLTGFVGYRYEKVNNRIFFRAGFTPLWELYDNFSNKNPGLFYPWGGVSCGLRF